MIGKTTRERIDTVLAAQHREGVFPDDYLDMVAADAENVVNHIRNTDVIEPWFIPVASRIAIYWIEKLGYNGAKDISENGISRNYEQGDVPNSLLRQIPPSAVVI